MRKIFALLALVLGVVSCQTEPEGFDATVGGEKEVNITVSLPEATRSDSAVGAFGNVDFDLYDVRFQCEVHYKGEKKSLETQYSDNGQTATFPVRLIPGRDYKFVVWADLVNEDTTADLHYNTASGLSAITLNDTWVAMDDTRDAYTCSEVCEFTGNGDINLTLKRPFAKLRVKTTDMNELLGVVPAKAKVTYSTEHYTSFDAVNQAPGTKADNGDHDTFAIVEYTENEGENKKTLFADYFFAKADQEVVNFTLEVFEANGTPIIERTFNTAIPVKRNTLTTIEGNILTYGDNITVTINPAFEEPENVVDIWDGVTVTEPAVVVDDETGEPVAVIDSASDLAWLAQYVNGTLASTLSTRGNEVVNFVLTADIDLNNEEWTPIGTATNCFMGNFDGNGKTIKNLNIANVALDTDGYAYAGLFGVTEGTAEKHNSVKDLTIENVTISTNGHIVAAAIAYPYYTDLENIKVKGNVSIKGGDYTAGVLAYTRRCVNASNISIEANEGSSIEGRTTVGGVIADIQTNGGLVANYSNFAVSGLTVKAAKNVGGISGIIGNQTLNGASVENVTIVSDDVRKGAISGALGGVSVITDAYVNNIAGAERLIGSTYDSGDECTVTINGVVYEYLANGSVKAGDTYYVNSVSALAEVMVKNNVVINIEKGQYLFTKKLSFGKNVTIYGNGATVKNDWSSYAFNNQCSFENVAVYDVNFSNNTIMDMAYAKGEVYFENCVFSHVRGNQSIHFDGQEGAKVTFKNCTMYGRNMLAASLDTVKFDGCKFLESTWNTEQGNKGVGTGWSGVNMWGKYEFTNCQFDSVCHCNCKTTGVVADFTNCTYTNGDAVTMELINGTAANIEGSAITIK